MPFNSFENYPMSWKPVIDKSQKSLYLQLARQLEQDIIKSRLLPGTKLPPQRELADYLDINVSTVSKAFRVCELKGLLSSTIGRGTFVSYDALANNRLLSEGNTGKLIEMGATVPEKSSNELLLELLKTMLSEHDAGKWFSYNRPADTIWQKDAAVRFLSRCGLAVSHENILFSNGGQNGLTAILAGLFHYGDRIGVDAHTYSGIKTSAAALGIQLIPIKQHNDEMDLDSLINACKNSGMKGIYVIPAHHNPTAKTMSLEKRKDIARIANEYDLIVIEDGTYQFMAETITPVASLVPHRTIYVASLSKSVAPGLRLAYIASPPLYRSEISEALYTLNVSVSPLMTELSSRVIVSGLLDDIIQRHRTNTKERNLIVNRYLNQLDCKGDLCCIFRWLKLPGNISGLEFERNARLAGVQVYAAQRFSVGTTAPEHAVRLAVCAPETITELETGLGILKELLEQ